MAPEYAASLAHCKKQPTFTFKPSESVLLLASYSTFPFGVILGLHFRWQYKRGWSHCLVDNYKTMKYKIMKWTIKFFAGIFTLLIPFTYALIATAISVAATKDASGDIPNGFGLFFVWIPICILNGFIVACGMHTCITRFFLHRCGYPLTKANFYL